MKRSPTYSVLVFLALMTIAMTACSPQNPTAAIVPLTPTMNSVAAQKTYSDPFAYCAAVGTIDTPDARYAGPQMSEEIVNGYKTAAGLETSTEPMEMFMKTTIWRCMDNQVYACNFGANLPCDSKANIDKTPSPAMEEYCKANPDSEFITMSETGHETIYSWHCTKDIPEVLDQIGEVDAAGFLAQIWYPIHPDSGSQSGTSATPTPLGGSEQILFASNRGGPYDDLYLLDTISLQVTRLTQGESNIFPGPFSPDGSQILFTGYGLTHSYVGLMAADGGHPVDLTQADVDEEFPTWSPDGKSIAFASRRDGNNEIYVLNTDGSQPRRLTNDPGDDFAPAWSPDGRQIAFVSDRDRTTGIYSIYLMNADGSEVTRLTDNEGSDYTPNWSPDGDQIVYRSSLNGSSDIYIINLDGSGLKNLTDNPAEDWSPSWSPDGNLITFQTNRDGNWEVYAMNADGIEPRNLTNNPADDQMPHWR